MEEDKLLDGRHAIEEAMSAFFHVLSLIRLYSIFKFMLARALMRNCPKCQKGPSVSSPIFLPSLRKLTYWYSVY